VTNSNRTRRAKSLLAALALLMTQALTPCLAQQPAAPPRRNQPETIDKRLERIELTLEEIQATQNAARSPRGARERASRLGRGTPFSLPDTFHVRALRTDASASPPLSAAGVEPDRDRDDLTDAEEAAIGTDPDNRDTDGDALWDGWEVHTIDGLDLHSLGASPLHKDIFVEMDFMRRASATNGLGPNDAVLRGIEAVFAAAPVQNPDGMTGINIHLIMGNEVTFDADLNPYQAEFARLRNANFDPKRARAFHYMIWANGYSGGTSSGISMDIPHSEFIVTLGRWNGNLGGTDTQKVGTFIHELGHNLGRTHGGSDHNNFKLNHLSVMNYLYQMRGVLHNGTRVFDYQRFALPSLDEGNLQEADGLGMSSALAGYSIIFGSTASGPRDIPCDGAIDWNGNGSIDVGRISVDLDSDTILGEMLETPDEWSALVFNGGVIGERFPVAGILDRSTDLYDRLRVVELTEEQNQLIESRLRRMPAQP
jgi:hypothetical protein